ncbi:MAG: DUF1295 domain-containing protein [Actinomycetota bacterium]
MSGHADVVGSAAIAIVVLMVATWLVSIVRRDVSIVDIVWGLGFVVVAWVAWAVGDGLGDRSNLLVAMVTIWGLRLAGHLYLRNRGEPEDHRYQLIRARRGPNFALTSLLYVFGLQAVLMFVVSLPVQLAMTPADPPVGVIGILGVTVWGTGFFFETVGDAQLTRFRNDPANDGHVLDWGLWRYTRHPNYFGDCLVWWGLWIVAAETGDALLAIVGPVLMTVLLLRFSGVAMLEKGLHTRKPAYADYVDRTSAFVPRRPTSEPPA